MNGIATIVACLSLCFIHQLFAQLNIDYEEAGAVEGIPCVSNGKFYRNPEAIGVRDCAKYYWCPRGKVLEFRCSSGLWFDIDRQICDFKSKIPTTNCEKSHDASTPRPLLSTESPICPEGQLACANRKCLNRDLFCDGTVDCDDASDESYCDPENDPNAPGRCDLSNCTLPDCFCSVDGTRIPGDLKPEETPQMVILTFDDAVNTENWEIYQSIFTPNRTNENGCPIRSTFFLSHEYTNYRHVQKLWNDGHEISVHSITHRQPELWWTFNATIEDWFDEFAGMANIINKFAGIPLEEIRGTRVPFLRIGWNTQLIMMREFGFLYDSSMVPAKSDPPLWPYTFDFRIPHKCSGSRQKCPSRSFPGMWEMVMNPLDIEGHICAMVDSCPTHLSEEEVFTMFMDNFNRHYRTNRAPFGLYFHTIWFKEKKNAKVFLQFIDELLKKPDVWFVTNYQAIEWMRTPTPLSQLNNFEPWKCQKSIDPNLVACNHPKSCRLHSRQIRGERYLHTCFECPEVYPWVKNEFGLEFKK
ncbi:chitin and LDLR binding deacetylase 3 [Brevipalpus obovatus]|uniref:chitin and LDLR binding deacetylase 3 n=1 Tax=Brevipalpus obovatus TaxID=246614 RepID=UPI003D9EFE5F